MLHNGFQKANGPHVQVDVKAKPFRVNLLYKHSSTFNHAQIIFISPPSQYISKQIPNIKSGHCKNLLQSALHLQPQAANHDCKNSGSSQTCIRFKSGTLTKIPRSRRSLRRAS
ncbi:putative 15.7 kDa protein [Human mastadenovirus C]|uniref:Putative 15.7 kDa protein n=1 Tax=Human mastadenovirus C TaxID=129951 RepID=A0A7D0TLQ0_9ADEN|nr:putative 15.7 kDa protein [Human mastadenovirus C]